MDVEVRIVNYQSSILIVPANWSGRDIYTYIKEGLRQEPEARKILWNDRVKHFEVIGSGQDIILNDWQRNMGYLQSSKI